MGSKQVIPTLMCNSASAEVVDGDVFGLVDVSEDLGRILGRNLGEARDDGGNSSGASSQALNDVLARITNPTTGPLDAEERDELERFCALFAAMNVEQPATN